MPARTPVYLQVAERLRTEILAGRWEAGDTLPTERELSVSLGASRASIREALRALEAQGLIVGGHASSRTVVGPGLSGALREAVGNLLRLQRIPLEDLIEFRRVIEGAAVHRAAALQDAEPLQDATTALAEMRQPDLDAETFHTLDLRFHTALMRASGNEALCLVFLSVRDAIARYLLERMAEHPDFSAGVQPLIREHAEILAAIQVHDGALAEARVHSHIAGFYEHFAGPAPDR
ncbi:MAG TPA: FCD domain-containing protein [Solirubrobacteraceae bacterium]|nr:FCD domain-containing protein [Solirubrobacteraceae bacterium]